MKFLLAQKDIDAQNTLDIQAKLSISGRAS